MQTVAAHHGIDIALPPLVEESGVVVDVLVLMFAPAVENLVDDQQSHLVASA